MERGVIIAAADPAAPDDPGMLADLGGWATDKVSGVAGAVVGSAIDGFVQSVAQGVESTLALIGTVWMKVPSPVLADAQHRPTGVVETISNDLSWYTLVFAMVGVLFAAGQMAMSHRGQAAKPALYMVLSLVVVTGAGAGVVSALIAAGDAFAPWIIEQATGEDFSASVATMITASTLTGVGSGLGLFVGVAALFGSIAQVIFMFFRAAMITLLMCVLPTIAATSATKGGSESLRKALGWLLAFILYKPVAGVVYAVGFLLIKGDEYGQGIPGATEAMNGTMQLLLGTTVIILAALTLPALVKFLVPMASAGASSLFSGAAAGAAVVATGAAVVTMGAGAAVMGGGAAAKGGDVAAKAAAPKAAAPPGANPAASSSAGAGPKAPAPSGDGAQGKPQGGQPTGGNGQKPQGGQPTGGNGQKWKDGAQVARGASDRIRSANDGVDEVMGGGPAGASGR